MFKVGQLVWCKKKNRYGATDYHVKCKVVYTSDEEKKYQSSGCGRILQWLRIYCLCRRL